MLMSALQAIVREASGMEVSRQSAARAVRQRLDQCGVDGLAAYLLRLNTDADELQALLELLVVPETWFFRDSEAFAAAAVTAADLLRRRASQPGQAERPLRLLSVPCATGEEPYSLVMALLDAGLPAARFTVDAIDISAAALAHAATGVYRQNAFRNPDLQFRDRYFTESAAGFMLAPAVRQAVRFSTGNLLRMAPAASGQRYDIIFCRNLLIYFDPPTQLQAIRILDSLLEEDGLLFSGYAELPVFSANGFATAHLRRAFALRKSVSDAGAAGSMASVAMNATYASMSHAAQQHATGAPSQPPLARATPPLPPAAPAREAPAGEASAALLSRARALADRGDLAAAATCLDACLEATPDSAPAYAMRGAVHAALGDLVRSEGCLRRALYLDPQQYDVICQLAVLAEQQGDADRARVLRSRAARLQARRHAGAGRTGR